jgi:CheY-like chemotaxis protein
MASILVIDDVPAVLLSVKIVLEGAGHQVTGAENGSLGLDLLGSGNFDVVITDIWMPGSTGAEVIRAARARSSRARFLVITGGDPNLRATQKHAPSPQNYGGDAVLLKPFEKVELLSAVARLLAVGPAGSAD